jgi:apolipoprotein D and lipocalin family protein
MINRAIIIAGVGLLLSGCLGIPEGIRPVSSFEAKRYLGTWYEIARLDHSFERGLSNITAQYTMLDEDTIRVTNRGFNVADQEWQQAQGVASFVDDDSTGYLKVSFFRPFYGSYVVFYLDENYQHAYVTGPDREYLWYLSRQPCITEPQKTAFIEKTKRLGFDTDSLIFVEHDACIGDAKSSVNGD